MICNVYTFVNAHSVRRMLCVYMCIYIYICTIFVCMDLFMYCTVTSVSFCVFYVTSVSLYSHKCFQVLAASALQDTGSRLSSRMLKPDCRKYEWLSY